MPGPGKEKERLKSTGGASGSKKSTQDANLHCDKCKSAVQSLICCERCILWMCMSCAGILSEAKFAILKEDDMTWFCTPCRGLAVQAAQTDKLIEYRCRHYMTIALDEIHRVKNELKKDIRAVSTSVTQIVEDIDTLKRDMKDHQDKVNSTANYQDPTFLNKTKQLIREETQEIRMRELRECNLILTNMEEEDRNTESGTATEEDSDMARVNDMIKNVLQLDDVEVTHVSRLPKPDSDERKRLVMVKLASREQRNKVLKNKTKLKREINWNDVYVSCDMTKNEKHENYLLRKELKERREKGEQVRLQSGKIVLEQEARNPPARKA